VDLERVGFVDEHGRELLAKMYTAGVEVRATGLMMTPSLRGVWGAVRKTAKQTT
jgi:hypothetical protein